MNKKVVKLIFDILGFAGLVLLIMKIYLEKSHKTESAETAGYICFTFLLAAAIGKLLMRFFPNSFNNKPTREEIEMKVHGDKN